MNMYYAEMHDCIYEKRNIKKFLFHKFATVYFCEILGNHLFARSYSKHF